MGWTIVVIITRGRRNCNNPNYPVHATSDSFAVLTQVNVGLDWQLCQHVSAQCGYRLMAMTGMGLTDSQVPMDGSATEMHRGHQAQQ